MHFIQKIVLSFICGSFCLIHADSLKDHLIEMRPISEAKKIVYVDMVADMFHPGHVNFLRQAKQFGDYLIVGINNDADVLSYKRLPVMTLDERVAMVASCRFVDAVLPSCPLYITDELVDTFDIKVIVHGDDFNSATVNKYYKVALERGIFKSVPYTPGVSTSQIVQRIFSRGPQGFEKATDTGSAP